jgi:hypothetical protein
MCNSLKKVNISTHVHVHVEFNTSTRAYFRSDNVLRPMMIFQCKIIDKQNEVSDVFSTTLYCSVILTE